MPRMCVCVCVHPDSRQAGRQAGRHLWLQHRPGYHNQACATGMGTGSGNLASYSNAVTAAAQPGDTKQAAASSALHPAPYNTLHPTTPRTTLQHHTPCTLQYHAQPTTTCTTQQHPAPCTYNTTHPAP